MLNGVKSKFQICPIYSMLRGVHMGSAGERQRASTKWLAKFSDCARTFAPHVYTTKC